MTGRRTPRCYFCSLLLAGLFPAAAASLQMPVLAMDTAEDHYGATVPAITRGITAEIEFLQECEYESIFIIHFMQAVIESADHYFTDQDTVLVRIIADWLDRHSIVRPQPVNTTADIEPAPGWQKMAVQRTFNPDLPITKE